jgi:phage terminase large subunit
MFYVTTATEKISNLKKRIRAIQGGTSAGKTIGVMQVLIDACQRDSNGDVTSVTSESLPHLKLGAMRDFLNIMKTHNYYEDSRWNRSDFTYNFESGAIMEFFSADQPIKVRGPRRKRLFCNEANRFPLETFEQLEVRTLEEIYLDWNPSNEFWFYTDILGKRDDVDHIILTYKDNEALDQKIIDSIEQRKNRKGWWQVYGLGQLGEVEGKIYKDWAIIDEIPHEARLERIGLDFGYSNDPTAIVDIYKYNSGYIFDETTYLKGLSNKQIADIILGKETNVLVVADSAEPKSIDEIKSYGVNIIGASKGKDSVAHGIQLVQDQRCSITKNSANIIREYRNFLWKTDKDGKILNEPEHEFKHSMDAISYGMTSLLTMPTFKSVSISRPQWTGFNRR